MRFYPLCDPLSLEEADRFQGFPRQNIKAVKTGEFRPVKEGEWFLSGAIPEAYKATADMWYKQHILVLVKTKTEMVTTIIPEGIPIPS